MRTPQRLRQSLRRGVAVTTAFIAPRIHRFKRNRRLLWAIFSGKTPLIFRTVIAVCVHVDYIIHCVSKKFPPLNSLYFRQILTDFQNFRTARKRMKFATKPIRHYPPQLRHAATLPWEIENSNFLQIFNRHGRKYKQVAFLSPLTL